MHFYSGQWCTFTPALTHHQQSKIVIITGYSDAFLNYAMQLGAEKGLNMVGGLSKPIKINDLEKLLKDALPSSR